MEKSKKRSHYKLRIVSGFTTLLLLVAVVMCMFVVLQSLSHGYASFFGNSLFRVVTGSMEPTIPVGTILMTRDTPIEEVQEDDIVCFRSTNPGSEGLIVTHRVTGVYDTPDGIRCLQTKGDNNPSIDVKPVMQNNLIGRVIWCTGDGSMMAGIVNFITGEYGFLACIVLPVLLIAVWIFRDAAKNLKKEMQQVQQRLEQEERQNAAPALTEEEYQEMVQRLKNEVRKEMEQNAQPCEQSDTICEDNLAQSVASDEDAVVAAPSSEAVPVDES